MKKVLALTTTAVILVGLISSCRPRQTPELAACDEGAITSLVDTFGSRLQNVSFQSPSVIDGMKRQYAQLVDPSLLEEWARNPASAPGRVVSSPWPDRIEVASLEVVSPGLCAVSGDIIEMTSTEVMNGGEAGRAPISLSVRKVEDRWIITGFVHPR